MKLLNGMFQNIVIAAGGIKRRRTVEGDHDKIGNSFDIQPFLSCPLSAASLSHCSNSCAN